MNNSPILIIGKNGKTGSRVNQRLQALGYSTRAVSRSTSPVFDWDNPTTWKSALIGVKAAYVTFQPDLAVPSAQATIKEFMRVAVESGLEHIVLLSGRGEEGAQRAEQAVQGSGISWNIIRSSWFCQNFSENFMLQGILSGELVLPAGDIVEPFVDADDIAEIVVATLTEFHHKNKLYEVTGPCAITFAQCVQEISDAIGKPVNYTSVSVTAYLDILREHGAPKDLLWLLHELFTVVLDGRNCQLMAGVEEALGRPATDFKTYVQKTIKTGVWDAIQQKEPA